jgi:hypothetical protein
MVELCPTIRGDSLLIQDVQSKQKKEKPLNHTKLHEKETIFRAASCDLVASLSSLFGLQPGIIYAPAA